MLAGSEKVNLQQIIHTLERAADKAEGSTGGPLIPAFDYVWDFLVGTTNDVNISRMIAFYEQNQHLSSDLSYNTFVDAPSSSFSDFYANQRLDEEHLAHPTMAAYKCAHLD